VCHVLVTPIGRSLQALYGQQYLEEEGHVTILFITLYELPKGFYVVLCLWILFFAYEAH
jgi:hypothetical protein